LRKQSKDKIAIQQKELDKNKTLHPLIMTI